MEVRRVWWLAARCDATARRKAPWRERGLRQLPVHRIGMPPELPAQGRQLAPGMVWGHLVVF
jgi:hypothetical protein